MSNRIPAAAYVDEREARCTISLGGVTSKAAITNQQAVSKDVQLKSGELRLASNGFREASHMEATSSRYRKVDSEEPSARTEV